MAADSAHRSFRDVAEAQVWSIEAGYRLDSSEGTSSGMPLFAVQRLPASLILEDNVQRVNDTRDVAQN